MKMTKKIMSLAIVFAMVMALAVSASAATITVEDAKNGETYTAYKIFDVTYAEGEDGKATGSNFAYKMHKDNEWRELVANYPADSETKTFTLTKDANSDCYLVTVTEGVTFNETAAAAFAAYLDANKTGKTGKTDVAENGVVELENLEPGYYFVDTTTGSLCSLFNYNTEQVLEEKNTYPTLTKKIVDGTNRVDNIVVETVDTVTFEIQVVVPTTVDKVITVHDILDEDMTYVGLVGTPANVTQKATACQGHTVCFEIAAAAAGSTVTFQYTATVNDDAETETNHTNTAYLTYSAHTGAQNTVNVKTFGIEVFKYTGTEEAKTALPGAKFVLKNATKDQYAVTDANGNLIAWTQYLELPEDAPEGAVAATVFETTANNNALFAINGLANGKYYLEEIEAPDGYNILTADVEVTINGADLDGDDMIQVINQTGTELPSTGGIGTTIFYALGGLMAVGAGVLLVAKKRMEA